MPGPRMVGKRRSDRVAMALPIQVKGTDLNGANFEEFTKTVVIGLNGAMFSLKRILAANQKIEILNVRQGGRVPFRVVGQVSSPDSPGSSGERNASAFRPHFGESIFRPCRKRKRRQPECSCGAPNARARLSVISPILRPKVFDLTQRIVHFCEPCQRWTEWQRAPVEAEESVSPAAAPAAAPTCENIAACRFK